MVVILTSWRRKQPREALTIICGTGTQAHAFSESSELGCLPECGWLALEGRLRASPSDGCWPWGLHDSLNCPCLECVSWGVWFTELFTCTTYGGNFAQGSLPGNFVYFRQYLAVVFKDKPLELWDVRTCTILREMSKNFPAITALVSYNLKSKQFSCIYMWWICFFTLSWNHYCRVFSC